MLKNSSKSKIILLTVGLLAHCLLLYGQDKSDYVWITSSNPSPLPGSEGNIFYFNNGELEIVYEQLTEGIYGNNASICDIDGELQFYTNGCNILNRDHQIMENGEMINSGDVWDDYCPAPAEDYPSIQDVIALPDRYNPDQYILIHKRMQVVTEPVFDIRVSELLYTKVDMSANDGLGIVTEKNIQIDSSINFGGGYGEAISHANGMDWWYLEIEEEEGNIVKYLFDENGIHKHDVQKIGSVASYDLSSLAGQACFSPDGTVYAKYDSSIGLDVMYLIVKLLL